MKGGTAMKPWTVAEQRKLLDLYKMHTSREIATLLGRSTQAVESRLTKLRSEGSVDAKCTIPNWTPEEDKQLFLLTSAEASAKLGRTIAACRKRKRKLKQLAKLAKGDSK